MFSGSKLSRRTARGNLTKQTQRIRSRRLACPLRRFSQPSSAGYAMGQTDTIQEIVQTKDRSYPLKRPPNHKVPVPRWTLKLPDDVTHIYTLYLGVQAHTQNDELISKAEQSVQKFLQGKEGEPIAVDILRVTNGFDLINSKIWVAYWTDSKEFDAKLQALDLKKLWNDLGDLKKNIGVWRESFITPIERLETNYASLLHQPGISQVPGGEFPAHNLTAYWGAGRDRLPAAKDDLFHPPDGVQPPESPPKGIGEHLKGSNYNNMCHIRSGQWWEQCPDDERESYENDLQGKLMGGMQYLWDNPEETGTLGLRFLQNVDENDKMIKETCGAGFFRNWADLEVWSSTHPSHLAIFVGALAHARRFGPDKKFMTWHEVSILKSGEAEFEYVNCDPTTGVIRWVPLDHEDL